MNSRKTSISRRELLKAGAAMSAAVSLSSGGPLFAAGPDKIRVAMLGCGDRGTKEAMDCLKVDAGVEMVVMAELLPDRPENSLKKMTKAFPNQVKVTPETSFIGFDACKEVVAMKDVDIVLLLTPPGFRPRIVRAAVEAGKHIFMEKPGAVDPVGVRSLMESAGRPIGTGAAPNGVGSRDRQAGRTWNGRSDAGPASSGSWATISSNGICTTWTRSTGRSAHTRPPASAWAAGNREPGRNTAISGTISRMFARVLSS